MWKFQDISATQNLCEINFDQFESPKTAKLTIWPALNFECLGIFGTLKFKIPKKSKFKASKIIKIADSNLPKSAKIDFTQ